MNILVTGGSGFLGSHVINQLLKNGYRVINYDLKNNLYINKKCKFVKGNILDYRKIDKILKKNKIKIIYHFAGLADIELSAKMPLKTARVNILGTVNILDLSIKNSIHKVIFSSSIYAISSNGGFYRCSKRACEDFFEEYSKKYNLKFSILRYGSLYGPNSDETNGIYKILKDAVKKRKLEYIGNKKAQRRYIHVKDAAWASIQILSNKFDNKYINLIGTKNYTINNIFNIIKKILKIDKSKKIHYLNNKFTGHYISKPNPLILEKGINFKFKKEKEVKIENGLKEIIDILKR